MIGGAEGIRLKPLNPSLDRVVSVLTCDVQCCLATARQERLESWHVVPRVTLALVVLLAELRVDLLLADVDTRLQRPLARHAVHHVLVHLSSRSSHSSSPPHPSHNVTVTRPD